MPRAEAPLMAALLALATLLSACTEQRATRAAGGLVEVRIDDFRFRPQVVRTRARELEVRVRNVGRLPHNFRLRGRGGTRLEISTMLPGEGAVRRIRLPRGDWRMFCSVANHEELGLYGTLVVP